MGDQKAQNVDEAYELQAPDGGWGYAVVVATVVVFSVTVIPLAAFGLVYGDFLKSIGDETTGTTISNGIFNTVYSFTGLLANGLLRKYSYRKVGFIGSITFISGAIGLIFVQNLIQLIVLFGIIEGIGFGLIMPSALSAFNSFFNKRMTVMMSICQASMIAFNMAVPQLASWSMMTFGFRGTLIGLASLTVLSLPAIAALQPVKRHMKKVLVQTINSTIVPVESTNPTMNALKQQEEPLMTQTKHMTVSQRSLHSYHGKPRKSVISLGDRVASVIAINQPTDGNEGARKDLSFWQSFANSMDMSLLKDPKYLNVSIGLALVFTGDMAFISIIPLMLRNSGFQPHQIAPMMAVFFGSDLASRILLTVVSSVIKFRSRHLVLFTSVFIVIARTALVSNDGYTWKLVSLGVLGFLRCFIQTPLPLVFSEEYQDQFSTAYSLFMAVNGVVSLICGPLMSMVKAYTHSDVMVCHVLTLAYIICVMAWTAEMTLCRKKSTTRGRK